MIILRFWHAIWILIMSNSTNSNDQIALCQIWHENVTQLQHQREKTTRRRLRLHRLYHAYESLTWHYSRLLGCTCIFFRSSSTKRKEMWPGTKNGIFGKPLRLHGIASATIPFHQYLLLPFNRWPQLWGHLSFCRPKKKISQRTTDFGTLFKQML